MMMLHYREVCGVSEILNRLFMFNAFFRLRILFFMYFTLFSH